MKKFLFIIVILGGAGWFYLYLPQPEGTRSAPEPESSLPAGWEQKPMPKPRPVLQAAPKATVSASQVINQVAQKHNLKVFQLLEPAPGVIRLTLRGPDRSALQAFLTTLRKTMTLRDLDLAGMSASKDPKGRTFYQAEYVIKY